MLIVSEALPLTVPVLEGEAPKLSAAVGEALIVELADAVVLAVMEGVPEPVGMAAAVTLPLREALPLLKGEAPKLNEAEGDALTVVLAERVKHGVGTGVPVPDTVPVAVPVGVFGAVTLPLNEALAVTEGEAPTVKELLGVADIVVLPLSVLDAVPADVGVGEPDCGSDCV